jgi:hypothetical protein
MESNLFASKFQNSNFFMPKNGYCHDFVTNSLRTRKMVFLVPHVITHKDNSVIITWRCNWGHTCESDCTYANVKGKNLVGQHYD